MRHTTQLSLPHNTVVPYSTVIFPVVTSGGVAGDMTTPQSHNCGKEGMPKSKTLKSSKLANPCHLELTQLCKFQQKMRSQLLMRFFFLSDQILIKKTCLVGHFPDIFRL